MRKAFGYSRANTAARIRRLAVGLALILVAIGLPRSPALADDASGLMGRWLVPSGEQKKSRMSPQCQQYAETDVQTVPESEIEIFSCDDPAFAPEKTRILEFVKSINEVYRAQNRRPYSETISGLCAVVSLVLVTVLPQGLRLKHEGRGKFLPHGIPHLRASPRLHTLF